MTVANNFKTILTDYLTQCSVDFALPNVSIGIVSPSEQLQLHHICLASSKTANQSVYKIGSLTKMITALAVLSLSTEEKLCLDDKVIQYLPWLSRGMDSNLKAAITIRDLLNHAAALPRGDYIRINPTIELIKDSIASTRCLVHPIKQFKYSNLGYILLGFIVETVTQLPFARYVQQRIFHPLTMVDSGFGQPTVASELSPPHGLRFFVKNSNLPFNLVKIPLFDAPHAAFDMHTTVADFQKLLTCLLSNGQFEGRSVFSESTIHQFMNDRLLITEKKHLSYGFGTLWSHIWQQESFHHKGGHWGHSASMLVFPKQKLGLVAMANRASASTELSLMLRSIAKHHFKSKKYQNIQTLNPYRKRLIGTYQDAENTLTITQKRNQLIAHFNNECGYPIVYRGNRSFLQKGGSQAQHLLNLHMQKGDIIGLTIGELYLERQDNHKRLKDKLLLKKLNFTGIYFHQSVGKIAIYNRNEQVILAFSPIKEAQLFQQAPNVFIQKTGPFAGELLHVLPEEQKLRIGTMIFSKIENN